MRLSEQRPLELQKLKAWVTEMLDPLLPKASTKIVHIWKCVGSLWGGHRSHKGKLPCALFQHPQHNHAATCHSASCEVFLFFATPARRGSSPVSGQACRGNGAGLRVRTQQKVYRHIYILCVYTIYNKYNNNYCISCIYIRVDATRQRLAQQKKPSRKLFPRIIRDQSMRTS